MSPLTKDSIRIMLSLNLLFLFLVVNIEQASSQRTWAIGKKQDTIITLNLKTGLITTSKLREKTDGAKNGFLPFDVPFILKVLADTNVHDLRLKIVKSKYVREELNNAPCENGCDTCNICGTDINPLPCKCDDNGTIGSISKYCPIQEFRSDNLKEVVAKLKLKIDTTEVELKAKEKETESQALKKEIGILNNTFLDVVQEIKSKNIRNAISKLVKTIVDLEANSKDYKAQINTLKKDLDNEIKKITSERLKEKIQPLVDTIRNLKEKLGAESKSKVSFTDDILERLETTLNGKIKTKTPPYKAKEKKNDLKERLNTIIKKLQENELDWEEEEWEIFIANITKHVIELKSIERELKKKQKKDCTCNDKYLNGKLFHKDRFKSCAKTYKAMGKGCRITEGCNTLNVFYIPVPSLDAHTRYTFYFEALEQTKPFKDAQKGEIINTLYSIVSKELEEITEYVENSIISGNAEVLKIKGQHESHNPRIKSFFNKAQDNLKGNKIDTLGFKACAINCEYNDIDTLEDVATKMEAYLKSLYKRKSCGTPCFPKEISDTLINLIKLDLTKFVFRKDGLNQTYKASVDSAEVVFKTAKDFFFHDFSHNDTFEILGEHTKRIRAFFNKRGVYGNQYPKVCISGQVKYERDYLNGVKLDSLGSKKELEENLKNIDSFIKNITSYSKEIKTQLDWIESPPLESFFSRNTLNNQEKEIKRLEAEKAQRRKNDNDISLAIRNNKQTLKKLAFKLKRLNQIKNRYKEDLEELSGQDSISKQKMVVALIDSIYKYDQMETDILLEYEGNLINQEYAEELFDETDQLLKKYLKSYKNKKARSNYLRLENILKNKLDTLKESLESFYVESLIIKKALEDYKETLSEIKSTLEKNIIKNLENSFLVTYRSASASSTEDFVTRTESYVVADIGFVLPFSYNSPPSGKILMKPYFGVNFSLSPINRQRIYSLLPRHGESAWWKFKKSLSISVGLTFNFDAAGDINEFDSNKNELFGGNNGGLSLLTQVGFRVADYARFNVGVMWVRQRNPNPLITEPTIMPLPCVSISYDLDVTQYLRTIGDLFTNRRDAAVK